MDKVALLSGSPLFEMLSNQELEAVAELCQLRALGAGETLFDEGELGDSVFVVASGEVDVLRRDAHGQLKSIATLEAPQFFGEMSLIDKEYRSATVRAKTPASVLRLTTEDLTTFRKSHRDGFTFVIINIARMLSARLREMNSQVARGP
jgi:CRP-like cAMP-binding protein